jgi:hypothetical protein
MRASRIALQRASSASFLVTKRSLTHWPRSTVVVDGTSTGECGARRRGVTVRCMSSGGSAGAGTTTAHPAAAAVVSPSGGVEGVVRMTLSRLPANTLTLESLGELDRILAGLEADPAVRGVVITSASPKIFSAGEGATHQWPPILQTQGSLTAKLPIGCTESSNSVTCSDRAHKFAHVAAVCTASTPYTVARDDSYSPPRRFYFCCATFLPAWPHTRMH